MMSRSMRLRGTGFSALLVLLAMPLAGQDLPPTSGTVRVVATGSEPFVIQSDNGPEGFSVDVWNAAAGGLGLAAQFEYVDDVNVALARVGAGMADVAIGPISITADRAEQVQFTQPYFHSSLGILAPVQGTLLDRFAPFLTTTFITGAVALVAVLSMVGALLWLAERRANPEHFPDSGVAGIGNGIWMALVTMTTVGYGDRVPHTVAGRVITGVWMLVSLVIASSLTAFLATALTLSQMDEAAIETASELNGRRVGVVAGTTSETFAGSFGARVVPAATLDDAVAAIAGGETEVVVFDRPMLRYVLNQQPELALQLSQSSYQPQNYGFAAGRGSGLADELSLEILRVQQSGELAEIEARWLGR